MLRDSKEPIQIAEFLFVEYTDKDVDRVAAALYEHAKATDSGYSPPSWSGPWREWYRSVARTAIQSFVAKETVE